MINIIPENGSMVITGFDCFSLDKTLDCGQCFRFKRAGEGWQGIFEGIYVELSQSGDRLIVHNCTQQAIAEKVAAYFDLSREYEPINKLLSSDSQVRAAIGTGAGIRIMRQAPWETLCSFIISQNNNIPRISKIIDALCILLGDKLNCGYSFPPPEKIAAAGIDGLAPIRAGFRAKYIIDAAEKVTTGAVVLEEVAGLQLQDAVSYLKQIKGVGDKVALCTLLFGYGMLDAFPVDVWVKRVVGKYYGQDFTPSCFSPYAGIAQQYLFYRERTL